MLSTQLRVTALLLPSTAAALGLACRVSRDSQANSGSVEQTQRRPDVVSSPAVQSGAPLDGLYVGTSANGTGWLAYLSFSGRRGVIYNPLGMIGVCSLTVDSGGRVSIVSALRSVWQYRLAGRTAGSGLRAALLMLDTRSGAVRDSAMLDLTRVGGTEHTGAMWPEFGGIYSDVRQNRETGDVFGEDLLVVADSDRTRVYHVVYEGSPYQPLAAERVARRGDSLRFTTRYPGAPSAVEVTAVVHGDTLTIAPDRVLLRQQSLSRAFLAPPRYTCQ